MDAHHEPTNAQLLEDINSLRELVRRAEADGSPDGLAAKSMFLELIARKERKLKSGAE